MHEWVLVLNSAFVSVFGCILSAAFCGIGKNKKGYLQIAVMTLVVLAIQGVVMLCGYGSLTKKLYPVMTHLPLAIMLGLLTRRGLWSLGSVFLAYLCCQLRRWIALFILVLIQGGKMEQAVIEMILTIPLLLLLLRTIALPVQQFGRQSLIVQVQFCLLPMLYYFFDYITMVYTDWLYSSMPVVVEFMPFVCCATYLIFLFRTYVENQRRTALEISRHSLNMQVEQSIRELELLREVQQQAAIYRHDLRHHLQYLLACMENEDCNEAKSYIQSIYKQIETQKMIPYCENEALNLILSYYARQAEEAGIVLELEVTMGSVIRIDTSDLCVLCSNALENAMNACRRLKEQVLPPVIQIKAYEKNEKIFLQIVNPCPYPVELENGMPVTREKGHGIGTQSICQIVRRYGGICSFSVENEQFYLRVSL